MWLAECGHAPHDTVVTYLRLSSREKSTGHHCVDRTLHDAAPAWNVCGDIKKRKETRPQGTGPKTLKTITFYSVFLVK